LDADYRGEVKALLYNLGQDDYKVQAGSKIGQLILEQIHMGDLSECMELDNTERGNQGFGSTG
ncbi:unnamed protein product, partial [Tuber aestivum]